MTPEAAHQIGHCVASHDATRYTDRPWFDATLNAWTREIERDCERRISGDDERADPVAMALALRGAAAFCAELRAELDARAAALESTR